MAKSGFPSDLKASDVTPERDYDDFMRSRREFLGAFGAAGLALAAGCAVGKSSAAEPPAPAGGGAPTPGGRGPFATLRKTDYKVDDKLSTEAQITGYNNYYEFGTRKDDPARNAGTLRTRPWSVTIGGLVKKPMTLAIDDLLKLAPLEERIYRFRCVEAWSLVVPWVGYSLSELLKQVEPQPGAKFVAFETLHDPAQMPLTKRTFLKWPYREGLRLDEAMHPLTLLCTGLYGKPLPNQNGAPVRVIAPWKYGFKSVKSVVKITLAAGQPFTTWNDMAPGEYGFYSNVNPEVDHPRWSQKSERRVGEFFQRPTLPFNGYAAQVAGLYAGMDLKKNF